MALPGPGEGKNPVAKSFRRIWSKSSLNRRAALSLSRRLWAALGCPEVFSSAPFGPLRVRKWVFQ